jgi:5'-3' exonuclease
MGVGSYFAWIIEHFKNDLLKSLNSSELEHLDFDNLYFDFNSLIHNASRRKDDAELIDMIKEVLRYFRYVLELVKPRKLVYIAIDGVPPMAKINQQRLRRFKSASEKQEMKEMYDHHRIPEKDRHGDKHDFNMISPGTGYMNALSANITKFIQTLKQQDDYKNVEFILSDSKEVGEGEQKIIQHIRLHASPPHSTTPIKSCIYGLDNDLLFLTLTLPNTCDIYLLREESNANIGKNNKFVSDKTSDLDTPKRFVSERYMMNDMPSFCFFVISELEKILISMLAPFTDISTLESCKLFANKYWSELITNAKTAYIPVQHTFCQTDNELKHLVIDYIFICYMLGNDFLPTIPSLKIRYGGLDDVIFSYKLSLQRNHTFLIDYTYNPTTNTYDNPSVNTVVYANMLEMLFNSMNKRLSIQSERINKENSYTERDLKTRCHTPIDRELHLYTNVRINRSFRQEQVSFDPDTNPQWRTQYYVKQFDYDHSMPLEDYGEIISTNYFKGMMWSLNYYITNNCVDWNWYYPYEGATTLEDMYTYITSLKSHGSVKTDDIDFVYGQPMNVYEQLLCILPPQSKNLIPDKLHLLMTDITSPIIHLYPSHTTINVIDKRLRWECHPKLPPVDVQQFRSVFEKFVSQLKS